MSAKQESSVSTDSMPVNTTTPHIWVQSQQDLSNVRRNLDIYFLSTGDLVLETCRYGDMEKPAKDWLGGSGIYATLGARLFTQWPGSYRIGWVANHGDDLHWKWEEELKSWHISLGRRPSVQHTAVGLSVRSHRSPSVSHHVFPTRGPRVGRGDLTPPLMNSYDAPPQPVTAEDLLHFPNHLNARVFHLHATPEEVVPFVKGVRSTRDSDRPPPFVIWEPKLKPCNPSRLGAVIAALPYVDVFSPTHNELFALFADIGHDDIASYSRILLQRGIGFDGLGAMVVRAGSQGVYIWDRLHNRGRRARTWHEVMMPSQRGRASLKGGHAFMGGFAIGYLQTADLFEAALYGNVASGMILEVDGLDLKSFSGGQDGKQEKWRQQDVQERLASYMMRIKETALSFEE